MVDYNEAERISRLLEIIKANGEKLTTKKATAGFDGFIDTLAKIIRDKPSEGSPVLFNHVKEFGDYISDKSGSLSLEINEIDSKPGGNMPIMANALAQLGITVHCIGALGFPQIHPVFKRLSSRCMIHSFASPGTSTAFEFNDGKIMLAQMGELNEMGWEKIRELIGIETLVDIFSESELLCIVNWSEIDTSTGIWKGLLADVLPILEGTDQSKIAFFDLSDCSKRSKQSINEALGLLNEFAHYAKPILGLNRNETRLVYAALHDTVPTDDMESMGRSIFGKLNLEMLLLHSSKESFVINKEGVTRVQSFFIKDPLVSTGAGDNFNAGFAVAQLIGSDPASCLLFANAVAALYVQSGISPTLTEVEIFLKKRSNT